MNIEQRISERNQRLSEANITPEMVAAALKVLHEAGILEYEASADELIVQEMLLAAKDAQKARGETE